MDLDIKQSNFPIKMVLLALLTIAILVYFYFYKEETIEKSTLEISQVVKGEMTFSLISAGILEPKIRRWLGSQSTGVVTHINFEQGSVIKKFDVLIQLSNPQIFTELQSAQSALKILKSELITQKYQLKNQKLDIESTMLDINSELQLATERLIAENKLADSGIYSKLDLSSSSSKVKQLKARLEIAKKRYEYFNATFDAQLVTKKAKIEDLEYKITLKQSQYDGLSIKSGLDGILQQVNTDIGKNVSQGENVALVVQEVPLIAKINISQGSIAKIQTGMEVIIEASGNKIVGHVIRIAPQVVDGAVNVTVELPSNYPKSLKSQLNISAVVKLPTLTNVLWLARPNNVNKGHNAFYRMTNDGTRAKKVDVTVGKVTSTQIEIISGLNEGDNIIINADELWDSEITVK